LLKLKLGYPSATEEEEILLHLADADPIAQLNSVLSEADLYNLRILSSKIIVAEDVRRYLVALVRATRERSTFVLGASPRASLALFRAARVLACLRGRSFVRPDDIKELAPAVLGHRVILSTEARLKAADPRLLLDELISSVPVPVEDNPAAIEVEGRRGGR
jgi:MoxR-like ATPase